MPFRHFLQPFSPPCQTVGVSFSKRLKNVSVGTDGLFCPQKHRLNFLVPAMTGKQQDCGHEDVFPDLIEHTLRGAGVRHVANQLRDCRFHAPQSVAQVFGLVSQLGSPSCVGVTPHDSRKGLGHKPGPGRAVTA